MAAGHAFLTQVSSRAWKCSECPLMFNAKDADALNRMLDRFMHHVRKMHAEDSATETGAPRFKAHRRRRPRAEEPEVRVIS